MRLFGRTKKSAQKPKVGLVLGGGGARGFIEVGALKAFKEHGIDFDLCVGTSVGSIVGALYCAKVSAEDIARAGERLELSDLHGRILLKPDDPKKVGNVVYKLIGDAKIEDLPVKFAAIATDLKTGKQVVIDRGAVRDAVSASSAYPIFYTPIQKDGLVLTDGGLVNNLPVDVCRMLGAEKTVAIDLGNRSRGTGSDGVGIIDMIKGLYSIMGANASVIGRTQADVLIAPDTTGFSATDKSGYREMMEIGYNAVNERIQDIKDLFAPSAENARK